MCLSIDVSENMDEEAAMTYLKVFFQSFPGIDIERDEKPTWQRQVPREKSGPITSQIQTRHATTTRIYYFHIHATSESIMNVEKICLDVLKDLHDSTTPQYENVVYGMSSVDIRLLR